MNRRARPAEKQASRQDLNRQKGADTSRHIKRQTIRKKFTTMYQLGVNKGTDQQRDRPAIRQAGRQADRLTGSHGWLTPG